MNPQQILGLILIVGALVLVAWSVWPVAKKQEPKEPEQSDEPDFVDQWGQVHSLIVELTMALDGNPTAQQKLSEVGAALYVDSNWVKDDESSE